VGVSLSPEQVDYCNDNGLQVYCCNYRDLLEATQWHGQFDGVIANGSLEHWVQPEDVQAGRMNSIYHESFAIAHNALDRSISEARYATTAIHVKREVEPEYLLTPWHRQPKGSDRRHFSLLHNWMGGYYPVDGQLERCANPYFTLEAEVDGSLGYKIANDYRMARMLRGLYTNPKMVWRIARSLARHPRVTATMIECYFIEKAWDWQFWGEDPPMKLLRHTWRRNPLVPT
jgi:hypothetical protein